MEEDLKIINKEKLSGKGIYIHSRKIKLNKVSKSWLRLKYKEKLHQYLFIILIISVLLKGFYFHSNITLRIEEKGNISVFWLR